MLLSDRLNTSNLKSFTINGLFGYKNIKIPFDKEAVILIAENGSGKTTILNALYYSISGKFDKLNTIDFDSIVLEFISGITEIKKSDLKKLVTTSKNNSLFNINKELERNLKALQKRISDKLEKPIQENLPKSILYFPTYRRIEEDLKNLGYGEENSKQLKLAKGEENLIKFGMDDVVAKFDEIKKEIKDSALNLFSKITGEILTQFVDGSEITPAMRKSIQPETLNIVLSRVGETNISKSYKEKIEKLVSSGNINNPEHDQLVYFLSKLVGVYEQQKEKDNSINQLATICNQYLHNKQIIYDQANVDISIVQTRNNQPIDIKNLSSGEKQIISLFSKIYLESSEDFILLFDEPELSLSIEWQRLLLPDILRSDRCKLLVAVTHSPFIFDNELDLNADDLDIFVQEH
jgi:predicted ATP-binding protein involved in virulence